MRARAKPPSAWTGRGDTPHPAQAHPYHAQLAGFTVTPSMCAEAKRIAALPAEERSKAAPKLRDSVGWSDMLDKLADSPVGEEHRRNVAAVTAINSGEG